MPSRSSRSAMHSPTTPSATSKSSTCLKIGTIRTITEQKRKAVGVAANKQDTCNSNSSERARSDKVKMNDTKIDADVEAAKFERDTWRAAGCMAPGELQ